jgi:transcriptional regulator with XRE-family HTH domain
MNIGKNIKKARKKRGLKQYELATQASVCKTTISLIESGKREPSIKVLMNLSRTLRVSADDLLGMKLFNMSQPSPYSQP